MTSVKTLSLVYNTVFEKYFLYSGFIGSLTQVNNGKKTLHREEELPWKNTLSQPQPGYASIRDSLKSHRTRRSSKKGYG
ncbi:9118_t:CDS:2 [Acaulospora morrowiae]|uniref:9118_t:CDS:1 n=1 Tax=Acaulospora morrowiae TaxID=94023 RepID=A0A9N9DDY3_9GLOM|nr:9118_t:CDS:2 [Acaulospora morrowiae]